MKADYPWDSFNITANETKNHTNKKETVERMYTDIGCMGGKKAKRIKKILYIKNKERKYWKSTGRHVSWHNLVSWINLLFILYLSTVHILYIYTVY